MGRNNSIELLAPAGNEAALRAAVQSGADAVYLGGVKFGARHGAANFTSEDLRRWCDYCHFYGVDVHLTLNTLIKERELEEFIEYAKELSAAGADAFIIQDIGAAELIRKALPDMPLHASTQMTVTSLEGVRYLEDMGFSRVVLARELDKREIAKICDAAKAEIEVFCHGAICMCYSGQCLMSSILGGRSGNRGRCAQPCRLPYSITDGNARTGTSFVLSPRDMALVKQLKELRDIGVASLKIEGRLKRAEYVSAVVGIYRKYLDSSASVSKEDMRELHDAFSRSGFTDGYFTGRRGAEMMSHKNSGGEGNIFTDSARKRAAENANERKIPITVSGSVRIGEPLELSAFDSDGNFVSVTGDTAQAAVNHPIDDERLRAQLAKTGSTPFTAEEIFTDTDKNAAIPVSAINGARRELLNKLADLRSKRPPHTVTGFSYAPKQTKREKLPVRFSAEVRTADQGREALTRGIDLVYAPKNIVPVLKEEFPKAEIVMRTEDIFAAEEAVCNSVTASSNAAVRFYKGMRIYGSHRLNVFNAAALSHYSGLELVTLSPELRLSEIRDIAAHSEVPFELIGYGRLPLMLMRNCPVKAMGMCQKHRDIYSLRDRRGEEFPIICRRDCIAELLNSKPLYMADRLEDIANTGAARIRLIFTTETAAKCARIIDIYNEAKNGNITSMRENTYTRGHYYRGIN